MIRFEGVFSVLPTPFHPNNEIDVASLQRVTELFVKAGVNGFTALGVTSETDKLNEHERTVVLETIFKTVNSRVPIVVGATAGGVATCVENAKSAQNMGAGAVMVSPPRMLKLNSDAVLGVYKALADAVDIPIVVQDYPPVSGFTMEPSLLARIAAEIPRARTIKLEDPPTPLKITRVRALAKDMDLKIFGGLGGVYLLEELLAGGTGAMTGFAFPEILVEIVRTFNEGKVNDAAGVFYKYVPLMRFEFQEGIGMAIRKEMLRRRGVFTSAHVRSPGVQIESATMKALDQLLGWYKQQGALPWMPA